MLNSFSFSVLSDGPQARKTGNEKELVLIREARGGHPRYFLAGLQEMDDYGSADSDNLKKTIDDVFLENLRIPQEDYQDRLVCAVPDGAVVNTGIYKGLLTQLMKKRPWLVKIHCILHCIELAVKDAMLDQKLSGIYNDIHQFLISLYYIQKKSPKLCCCLNATTEALDVDFIKFKKVHGTRFIFKLLLTRKEDLMSFSMIGFSPSTPLRK